MKRPVMPIFVITALLCVSAAPAMANEAKTISVSDAWARATPGAAANANAAVYFTIHNPGTEADSLIGASTDAAKAALFHTSEMTDGVMRMERTKTVTVPAGATVTFTPSGMHLMLMELKAPLREGGTFAVNLRFKKKGEVHVPVQVLGPAAMGPTPQPAH